MESDEAPVEPEPTPASLASANTAQVATNHSEDQVSAFRTLISAGKYSGCVCLQISQAAAAQVQHPAQPAAPSSQPPAQAQTLSFMADAPVEPEADSKYFNSANQQTKPRGFNDEIMSGQYTFLQDSELDSQEASTSLS